jgi:hypothetical protein
VKLSTAYSTGLGILSEAFTDGFIPSIHEFALKEDVRSEGAEKNNSNL